MVCPVDVGGELLVAGFSEAPPGGTVLDLSSYEAGPAFRLLPGTCGSRLHLRDLTLLLPAPSPEALAAAPASVLAHLITAAGSAATADGGEDASPTAGSVLLSDVTLMLPGDAGLRAFMSRLCEPTSWRHREAAQLRVLGGVVMYGNDTMQLAPPAPPAVLLRTNVTSRSASAAPWACSATAVSGAHELRATAAELLAATSGTVLLSLTGNVTIDPELGDWGPSGLVVPWGVTLGLYGDPTPGRAVQLDFGGLESAILAEDRGVVLFADLLLLGLPYPRDVTEIRALLAAWVHAVRFQVPRIPGFTGARNPPIQLVARRCTIVVPALELAWWQVAAEANAGRTPGLETLNWYLVTTWSLTLVNGSVAGGVGGAGITAGGEQGGKTASLRIATLAERPRIPQTQLSSCTLTTLGASGAVSSPQAAAVAASWPLGAQYDEAEALQLRFGGFTVTRQQRLTLQFCSLGAQQHSLLVSSWQWNTSLPDWMLDGTAGSATAAPVVYTTYDTFDVALYGRDGPQEGMPCTIRAAPASQTQKRTFWDMRKRVQRGSRCPPGLAPPASNPTIP
ncbi:hypothetical protein GPECTOR_1g438 [Gonium pectorale]|uniref:Uncharacterized protein n=1 Tax=Gonium pectorale TaxID=33097 RepID=A0A150H2U6_GONPE|nr:hypothetical protein GPECTOR_1g438 [Gonium pectorale]|eukprot:KXZ56489.1 hypothetical protein GPECTOR_1g438 [Gonium pectorale]